MSIIEFTDSIRQELDGTWQEVSGCFRVRREIIAGAPRLFLHHNGSVHVLASIGATLQLRPEYQIDEGGWIDSGWGLDGIRCTFPSGYDEPVNLQCNRPAFLDAVTAGTIVVTRIMAKCSGSVVLCDSNIVPQEEAGKIWAQSESWILAEGEDDQLPVFELSSFINLYFDEGALDRNDSNTWVKSLGDGRVFVLGGNTDGVLDAVEVVIHDITDAGIPTFAVNAGTGVAYNPTLIGDMSDRNHVLARAGEAGKILCCLRDWGVVLVFDAGTSGQTLQTTVEHALSLDRAFANDATTCAVYFPFANKSLLHVNDGSSPWNNYLMPITISGAIVTEGTPVQLWDGDNYGIDIDFTSAGSSCGESGRGVYGFRLYDGVGHSMRFWVVQVNSSGVITYLTAEVASMQLPGVPDAYPIQMAGDPDSDRVVFAYTESFGGTTIKLVAAKIVANALVFGTPITYDTTVTGRCELLWVSGSNPILVTGTGTVSETLKLAVDDVTITPDYANRKAIALPSGAYASLDYDAGIDRIVYGLFDQSDLTPEGVNLAIANV